MLDVLIIGAGPIGLACGIEAEKSNLSYLIVEKGTLVNSLYNYPKNMTFFSTSQKLEIGGVPFISHNSKPIRSEALEYYRRVASSWNLKLSLYNAVNSINKEADFFEVVTEKRTFQCKAIIIASGFYDLPNLLNVEGEDLPKVKHYYDEPHPYFNQKIAVIGAANSAVDVALETLRKGAEVTMIIREEDIKETVKYWVRPDIVNRIKEESIRVFFNSKVRLIEPKCIHVETPDGPQIIENDFVLAMTGYRPNFTFLQEAGIRLQEDEFQTPVFNPETYESNVPNLYLAGVICGGLKTNSYFIENSRVHAVKIFEDLKRKQPSLNP